MTFLMFAHVHVHCFLQVYTCRLLRLIAMDTLVLETFSVSLFTSV